MPHEYDEIYNAAVALGDSRLSGAETARILSNKLVDIAARFCAHFDAKMAGELG